MKESLVLTGAVTLWLDTTRGLSYTMVGLMVHTGRVKCTRLGMDALTVTGCMCHQCSSALRRQTLFSFGSLFAGIGGIDLGLERAGMTCAWQVENDPWCTEILAKHWPDVPRYGDIANVETSELAPVDLIAGGFPCQPVSLARGDKIEGTADARWLWPQFYRVVSEVRPRFVIVENVPGLYLRGGADVITDLAKIGYDAEWDTVSAQAIGAPHKRARIFIVAYPRRELWQAGMEIREGVLRGRPVPRIDQRSSEVDATESNISHSVLTRPQGCRTEHQLRAGEEEESSCGCSWWSTEPSVGRVAHGVPRRVDRLRGLGNAVVPQVAEWVGRRIMNVV